MQACRLCLRTWRPSFDLQVEGLSKPCHCILLAFQAVDYAEVGISTPDIHFLNPFRMSDRADDLVL